MSEGKSSLRLFFLFSYHFFFHNVFASSHFTSSTHGFGYNGAYPLTLFRQTLEVECARWLTAAGVEPNDTSYQRAEQEGRLEIVEVLSDADADKENRGLKRQKTE